MKKLTYILLLLGFLTSCGPHRAKCGVGRRCLVEVQKQQIEKQQTKLS